MFGRFRRRFTASSLLLILTAGGCNAAPPSAAGQTALDAYVAGQRFAMDGDCTRATLFYRIASQRDPHFLKAFVGVAACAQRSGDYRSAVRAYDAAIAAAPGNYELYWRRGIVEGLEGDTAAAVRDEQFALRSAPDQISTYCDIAQAFATQGDFRGAVIAITKAIALSPKRSDLLKTRADYYMSQQDLYSAERDYRAALATARTVTQRALVYAASARLFQQEERPDAASFAIERAVALNPRNVAYLEEAGSIFADEGRFLDAIAAYHSAIGYLRDKTAIAETRLDLGDVYARAGQAKAAALQYKITQALSDDRRIKDAAASRMRALGAR
jgi:tetratricopeptide (TPR) repeat protein